MRSEYLKKGKRVTELRHRSIYKLRSEYLKTCVQITVPINTNQSQYIYLCCSEKIKFTRNIYKYDVNK